MRAVLVDRPGGPEALRLGEAPDPEPGPGEALIRVAATAVNRADLMQRAGGYPPPAGASHILGLEASGWVERAPEDSGLTLGQPVMALLAGGGYAERVAVPVGQTMPVPEGIDLVHAAAIPEVFTTAWLSLERLAGLRAGEALLVHAAASGVGTAALQIARERGALGIGTTRDADKADAIRAVGGRPIVVEDGRFAQAVRDATGGRGADVVLDMVGAAYLEETVAALAHGGRISVIGLLGGARGTLDLGGLLRRQGRLTASTLRARSVDEKSGLIAELAAWALPRFVDGRLRPVVDDVLPIERVAEAHRRLERNATAGKIVLRVTAT